ncbi:MAG TPA: hypothetical protein VEW93_02785 [Acidimicrobiales bacterium]|nr:hypothetical protein [Acidimicrobiales bacterium]
MPTRHLGPAALLPLLLLALAACGDGQGPDVVADTTGAPAPPTASADPTETSTSTVERPPPSQTRATSSTAPDPPGPRPCGTVTAPDGTDLSVVILSGGGDCGDAEALVDIYHHEPPTAPSGPRRLVSIDGWECTTDPAAQPGPVVTCVLPGAGTVTAHP